MQSNESGRFFPDWKHWGIAVLDLQEKSGGDGDGTAPHQQDCSAAAAAPPQPRAGVVAR